MHQTCHNEKSWYSDVVHLSASLPRAHIEDTCIASNVITPGRHHVINTFAATDEFSSINVHRKVLLTNILVIQLYNGTTADSQLAPQQKSYPGIADR